MKQKHNITKDKFNKVPKKLSDILDAYCEEGNNMKKIWKMTTKNGIEIPCQKTLGNDKNLYYAKSINIASMVEFDDEKLTAHIDIHRDYVFKNKKEYEIYKNNLDDIQRINGWGECEVH